MNWLDDYRTLSIEEIEFYNFIEKENKKEVFIIGSSQITGVNATLINNHLNEKNENLQVYNIGKSADRPNVRMKTFDYILEAKPEIIVYGVGHRDFRENITTQEDSPLRSGVGIFVHPKEIIEDTILEPMDFYKTDYSFLKDPHTSTWRSISGSVTTISNFGVSGIYSIITDVVFQDEGKFSLFDEKPNQKKYFKNSPFFFHTPREISNILNPQMSKEDITLQCPYLDRINIESLRDSTNYIALDNMIKKSKSNGINFILFSTPVHPICLELYELDNDNERFKNILLELSKNYEIPVYFLHDKYEKDGIWSSGDHVSMNEDSVDYSHDIAKMIKELI
tara:strand:- start:347 stop:1357 length:1011 start_codon:yes stop_codon:yes gene_type:complete